MNAALSALLLLVPGQAIDSRQVNLHGEIPFSEALAAIEKQTGNRIVDQRSQKSDKKLQLDVKQASFWQALDAIAVAANVRYSPYRTEDAIALVDGPFRAVPAADAGPFRVSVKRVTLTNDLESGTRSCQASVEVAWEPRLQPFYLDGAPVPQRNAVEVPLQLPTPERRATAISFNGKFSLITPVKMLQFRFDQLKPTRSASAKMEEGVSVTLAQIVATADRWSFDMVITNPPGGPEFESFQHWLHNNQIYLEKGAGATKQIWKPHAADEQQLDIITSTRAAMRYHFNHRGRNLDDIGTLADWTLVYRTPGRIVQVEIPYQFKDVPLP